MSLPFENRYKAFRILNYGKPYTNYKTYNIKYHLDNTTNILAIYVDNNTCNKIPTNKAVLCDIDENTELLLSEYKFVNKYFVEIHYIPEEKKPILEYIMTEYDINVLLSKYGYVVNI